MKTPPIDLTDETLRVKDWIDGLIALSLENRRKNLPRPTVRFEGDGVSIDIGIVRAMKGDKVVFELADEA